MKKFLVVSVTVAFLFAFSSPALAALRVDDFIPPVQASSEAERAERLKVREPGEVKEVEGEVTEEPATLSAASVQEGLAQIFAEIEQGLTPPVGGRKEDVKQGPSGTVQKLDDL